MTRRPPTTFSPSTEARARIWDPTFASRPGITPDALVTLTVGPYGSSASGTITDLTDGSTQPIASSSIKINGPSSACS